MHVIKAYKTIDGKLFESDTEARAWELTLIRNQLRTFLDQKISDLMPNFTDRVLEHSDELLQLLEHYTTLRDLPI